MASIRGWQSLAEGRRGWGRRRESVGRAGKGHGLPLQWCDRWAQGAQGVRRCFAGRSGFAWKLYWDSNARGFLCT
jgi:hypothetical protein